MAAHHRNKNLAEQQNQINFSFDSGELDIKYFAFRGVSLLTKKLEKSVII